MSEANSINLSLTTLGKCIRAMSSQNSFIPYRESKLTHALKDVFTRCENLNILINISEDPLS